MKDLSLHIMDIVQNSIRAGASLIGIEIDATTGSNKYLLRITDDGCGMDKETVERVTDPYFTSRTTRKVGLGIPLLKQNAERTGGTFEIRSIPGKGTTLEASFVSNHLDFLPEGDLAGTICQLACGNPTLDFCLNYHTEKGSYEFDTREVKNVLEDVRIEDPGVYPLLKQMIDENIRQLIQ